MCQPATTTCSICGHPVNQSGKGRPREYCGGVCKQIRNSLDEFMRAMEAVRFADIEHARRMAAELFQGYNDVHQAVMAHKRQATPKASGAVEAGAAR